MWLLILGGSFGKTGLDAPIASGRPSRKSSKALKALLDQIQKAEITEQSDDPTNLVESESESDSNSQGSSTSGSEEEPVTVAPIRQPVVKKKVAAKVVSAGDTSDDHDASSDGMDLTSIAVIAYKLLCTAPFRVMLEIANERTKLRKIERIQSDISWTDLREIIALRLGIHPSSLQAQYRLSTQPKALPLDLQTENDLEMMLALVEPLVVPPLLANGWCSTHKMKPVTIQIFDKEEAVAVPDTKVYYSHVASHACFSSNNPEV